MLARRLIRKDQRCTDSSELGSPVLAIQSSADRTPELLGNQLSAVTNAEYRDAQVVHSRVESWRAINMHTLRSTGQNDRRGTLSSHLSGTQSVADDFGEHVQFTDTPRNQLSVLSTEVDNEHGSPFRSGVATVVAARFGAGVMRDLLRLTQDCES